MRLYWAADFSTLVVCVCDDDDGQFLCLNHIEMEKKNENDIADYKGLYIHIYIYWHMCEHIKIHIRPSLIANYTREKKTRDVVAAAAAADSAIISSYININIIIISEMCFYLIL